MRSKRKYLHKHGCESKAQATSETLYPFGCPVAASVTIITFTTSPNLLKCRERLSLVAAK